MCGRGMCMAAAALAAAMLAGGCGPGEQGGGAGASAGGAGEGFALTSSAFGEGQAIPVLHGFGGGNLSPRLTWSGTPAGTAELALVVSDPDAPGGFTHWLVYGIPATVYELPEGRPDRERRLSVPDGVMQGQNSFGGIGWGGPEPPEGDTHHYVFTLYALREKLGADGGMTREQFDQAVAGKVLATATLTGTFRRS